ncbi:aromatic amino acid ammonia-lyase [Hydrogenophaga sp. BPS33]|uniref:aromatic amino acid ammonia-lyase n=1 Tax=Hydrogenophaga sp. BPS33 TaxID=2651974 RepID=UPI00131F71E1|nr:aromatic amino acid ammonia-lyase [Hydrogenophaga sp. BPS33]QHE86530.1 aromatic amino acid lyase [Hydrogenophaga sp. BPS33]
MVTLPQIELDGQTLSARDVVQIARHGAAVALAPAALARMEASRAVVERIVASGELVYGVTSSVATKTGTPLDPRRYGEFNRRLLETHDMGMGPLASREMVRAMLVVMLNNMASGRLGVRPVLANLLVDALNTQREFKVHLWGSTGESDMAAVANIALDLYAGTELAAGETIALINSSPVSIGLAALAMADLGNILASWPLAAALSMEGYGANPSPVSDVAVRSRPFKGLQRAAQAIAAQLHGSHLMSAGGPRHLQDPLAFRSLPITLGNAFDSHDFAAGQFAIELNASQNNPVVSIEEQRLVSVANFDLLALSMALDTLRLGIAPLVTSSTERVAKLVDSFWSGLDSGLLAQDDVGLPGFNGMAQVHKGITAEARLLAAPVVTELPSSSHSNGNLDRVSMASLAARRTLELAQLCKSILAVELVVAAQAVDLRQPPRLGAGTSKLHGFVRGLVPHAGGAQRVPHPAPVLEALERLDWQLDSIPPTTTGDAR